MIRRLMPLRTTILRSSISSSICNKYSGDFKYDDLFHSHQHHFSSVDQNQAKTNVISYISRLRISQFHTTPSRRHITSNDNDEPAATKHSTPYILTDVGEGIAEVEVLQWYVNVGDHVKEFDMLCDVQSDKANVPITSRYDGVVTKLCGSVGDMIKTGTPLMYISTDDAPHNEYDDSPDKDEEASNVTAPSLSGKEENALTSTVDENDNKSGGKADSDHEAVATTIKKEENDESVVKMDAQKVQASPAVRKFAREYEIDLSKLLPGSGPNGRILKSDIMKYVTQPKGQTEEKVIKDTSFIRRRGSIRRDPPQPQPLRGYARQMFKSMKDSLNVPHMMLGDEIIMTNLMEARNISKKSTLYQTYQLPKLTYLPFFIKAASLSLEDYPLLNSSLVMDIASDNNSDTCIQEHRHHNIGVAMATSRGLVVAVVHQCESLSVVEIQQELIRLETMAKSGSLSQSDVTGATFSLSNIGVIGGTYTQPVVVPPTVAIGAIGKIQYMPRYFTDDEDEIPTKTPLINISWSADHRVVDGASLALFNNLFKSYIEQPAEMLLRMK